MAAAVPVLALVWRVELCQDRFQRVEPRRQREVCVIKGLAQWRDQRSSLVGSQLEGVFVTHTRIRQS